MNFNLNTTKICQGIVDPLEGKCDDVLQNVKTKVYTGEAIIVTFVSAMLIWRIAYTALSIKKSCDSKYSSYNTVEDGFADLNESRLLPRKKICKCAIANQVVSSMAWLVCGISAVMLITKVNSVLTDATCNDTSKDADELCIYIVDTIYHSIFG